MNDPSTIPPTDEETPVARTPDLCSQAESLIRRHPVLAALTTIGVGCAIGIVTREFLTPPPTPKQRALRLLEDIQQQLSDLAEPAYDRASHLADDGVSAMKRGLDSVSHSKFASRLSHLFS